MLIAGLLVLQQAVIPSPAPAQLDPCNPIPIPDLCNPGGSPSPSPPPGNGGGGDGGSGGGGDGGTGGGDGGTGGGGPGGGGGGGGGPGGGGGERSRPGGGGGPRAGADGRNERGRVEAISPEFFLGGPKNTARLVTILSELTTYGVPLRKSLLSVVGPFPVAGLAWWTDDWHACRDGCSRLHKGLDIFAREGTPVVAAADGVVSQKDEGELAGLYVEITDPQGAEYFYAHLSGWPDGLEVGQRVRMGDVVGFVGNTGNAITTPPHLHFEYQPDGIPVPPKPLVDRWLRIAERRALDLVREYAGEEPLALEDLDAFRLTRLFDLGGGGLGNEPSDSQLLILAGLQPAASSFEMARQTLDRMAWEIDWSAQIEAELAELIREYERHAAAEQMLTSPLIAATRPEAIEGPFPDGAELGD